MLLVALILLPGLSCGALSTERVYCPATGEQRLCEHAACPHAGHPHVHYRVAEAPARPESPAALLPAASAPQQSAPAPRPLSVLRPAVQGLRSRAPIEWYCLCLPLLL